MSRHMRQLDHSTNHHHPRLVGNIVNRHQHRPDVDPEECWWSRKWSGYSNRNLTRYHFIVVCDPHAKSDLGQNHHDLRGGTIWVFQINQISTLYTFHFTSRHTSRRVFNESQVSSTTHKHTHFKRAFQLKHNTDEVTLLFLLQNDTLQRNVKLFLLGDFRNNQVLFGITYVVYCARGTLECRVGVCKLYTHFDNGISIRGLLCFYVWFLWLI